MLETQTQTQTKEFTNGSIPGVSSIVVNNEENIASITMGEGDIFRFNKNQITEMISVLVEVHDYIERQKDNTMGLFNDLEEDVEEITISPELIDEEIIEPTGFDEIIRNATAFLYMKEDFTNQRISNNEMSTALHILRDSINSYLNSVDDTNTHGTEKEQQTKSTGE